MADLPLMIRTVHPAGIPTTEQKNSLKTAFFVLRLEKSIRTAILLGQLDSQEAIVF